MTRPTKDNEREECIQMEIIADAYGPEEQALGWYYSREEHVHVPFAARCIAQHSASLMSATTNDISPPTGACRDPGGEEPDAGQPLRADQLAAPLLDLALEVGRFSDASGISADAASRWIEVTGDLGLDAEVWPEPGAQPKLDRAEALLALLAVPRRTVDMWRRHLGLVADQIPG